MDLDSWRTETPRDTRDFAGDRERYSRFWQRGADLLGRLPAKPRRTAAEAEAAETVKTIARETRRRFLAAHAGAVYDALTCRRTRFVRVEKLAYEASELVPGLTPTRAQIAGESAHPQRDKDGLEIDQGIFFAAVLADAAAGTHLCHAMLLPRADALERLPELQKSGHLDLGSAEVFRKGAASYVIGKNPRHLNAEDDSTIDAAEIAVDLATLDSRTRIGVLRGAHVRGGKYAGRRMLGSGVNLTHLYHGKIPFLWFMRRELGIVNKLYRGVASEEMVPDDVGGQTTEKPWIAAVEEFAIGGHCQYLLVMDYVLAARGAYMTLPARKEGIIPGAANMRLPRLTGESLARQLIMYERRLDCDSAEGRLICDEIVEPAEMDAALDAVVENLAGSGVVSAAANRRAIRVTQEPLDLFRRYMATYALAQAHCQFSPALIENLERHWKAQQRTL